MLLVESIRAPTAVSNRLRVTRWILFVVKKQQTVVETQVYERNNFTFLQKKNFFCNSFLNSQIFHWVQIKTGRNWTQSLRELLSKVLRGESISILLVIQNQLSSKNRNREYVKLFLPGSTLPRPQRREPCPKQSPEESKMKLTAWFCFTSLLLTLTYFKPGQNNYNAIQTCPIRKRVNP